MPEIKTRERVKDIKKLDKSAVIGQRMKAAYIRSKERGVGNGGEQPCRVCGGSSTRRNQRRRPAWRI